MGIKKIKGTKQTVITPVEVESYSALAKQWLEEHTRQLSIFAVILLLILVGVWGWGNYQESRERRAMEEYAQILQKWPKQGIEAAEAWQKLISDIEAYVQKHPGTTPILNAQLDLAYACFRAQRFEDALKWSNAVLQQASQGSDLKLLARQQLALSYEAAGKIDEAAPHWQALARDNKLGLKRESEWRLAKLAERKGDYAQAAVHYEEAIKTPGSYPATAMIEAEMATARSKTAETGKTPSVQPQ